MKTPNYLIQIPEPCHEDWNAMQPDATGKFCGSCNKSVIDFTDKTDAEIRLILANNKSDKVCGHFKTTQLNRPLTIRVDLNDLPKNISSTRSFVIAVFLAFGAALFSWTDLNGQVRGEVEVVKPKHETTHIKGKIKAPIIKKNDPLPVDTPVIPLETYINGGLRFVEAPADTVIPEQDAPVYTKFHHVPILRMGAITEVPVEVSDSVLTIMTEPTAHKTIPEENTGFITDQTKLQVLPNPSSGNVRITYQLRKRSDVQLDILDQKGNVVKSIINLARQYDGNYEIPVDLSDIANGVYTVRLICDDKKQTAKLLLEN